jgi:hypothetical protein
MRRSVLFQTALVLLALSGTELGAQEGGGAQSSEVLVAVTAAPGAEEAFRPVIADAVQYKLRPYDLQVIVRKNLPGGPLGAELEDQAGAEFLLECRYSRAGSQMELSLDWRDRRSGTRLAAAQRRGRVDLALDALILEALDELLNQLRGRIGERPVQATPVRAAPEALPVPAAQPAPAKPIGPVAQPAPAAPVEPAAQATPVVAALPVLKPGPGDAPSPMPAVPAGKPGSRAEPAARGARFVLSPAVGPFLPLGAARYFFPLGIQSLVRGDFLLLAGRGSMGLGLLLGATAFAAQGSMERSLNFLLPLGVSLSYALQLGSRWNLLFQLGAGPALLVMSLESREPLVKPLAYVRSELGAELALTRRLGLALAAAYEVYFEEPYLIMGFAPTLSLCWRM